MNISEIEKVVKSFQGAFFKRANSSSAGLLKSKIRGTGLQFRDHQIYAHGDDVRFIDWKVSARNSNIHIKTFEEDRNTEINVVIDIGPTMYYGSNKKTKLQVCLEITALLYLLAQKNNDQVKVLLIMNDQVTLLPSQKGKMGIIIFIKQLERLGIYDSHGQFNLRQQEKIKSNDTGILKTELNKLIHKKKEVIVLSDMNFSEELKALIVKTRNCHPIKVLSPIDNTPLRFSINSGKWKGTGINFKKNESIKIPTIRTDEKYLELFIRRLK